MTNADMAIALLRVSTGLVVAAHGAAKVWLGGRIAGTAQWFESIGMRPGWLHARMAAGTEIVAGLLLAVGLLTPFASTAIVALMVVAAWTVHRKNGFFIVAEGWEYNLVLAVAAITVGISGAGRASVDHLLSSGSLLSGWLGFLVVTLGGVAAATAHLAVFYRPERQP